MKGLNILAVLVIISSSPFSQAQNFLNLDSEVQASPEALRQEKRQLEEEVVELRTERDQLEVEIEEIGFLEVELVSSFRSQSRFDKKLDTIDGIDYEDEEAIFGGELLRRAEIDIDEAIGASSSISTLLGRRTTVDPKSYSSLRARKLALQVSDKIISSQQAPEPPSTCNPDKPKVTPTADLLRATVLKCKESVQRLIDSVESLDIPALVAKELEPIKSDLESRLKTVRRAIDTKEARLFDVEGQIGKSEDLTETIVQWTIPSLGLLLVAILLGPRLYSESLQKEIFGTKLVLELLTVYILVSTILILGLASRIENEVLGTLLGGISGYVLGRSFRGRDEASVYRSNDAQQGG